MSSYAKCQLIGNLGRDPETRYSKAGTMNVSFSIAASNRYTDRSGTPQEKTTWFRVTAWGNLAEFLDRVAQDGQLGKGKPVFVSGRIELNEYTNQSGEAKSSLDVNADDVILLGPRTNAPVVADDQEPLPF